MCACSTAAGCSLRSLPCCGAHSAVSTGLTGSGLILSLLSLPSVLSEHMKVLLGAEDCRGSEGKSDGDFLQVTGRFLVGLEVSPGAEDLLSEHSSLLVSPLDLGLGSHT